MRNLHMSVDTERLSPAWGFSFLDPLLKLYLDSITITFIKQDGSPNNDQDHVCWLHDLLNRDILYEYVDIDMFAVYATDAGRVTFDLALRNGNQVQAWMRQNHHVDFVGIRRYYVQKGLVVARHGDCGECVVDGDHVWEAALGGRLPTKVEIGLLRIMAYIFVMCVMAHVVRLLA
jgi:hypothetical protein